MKEEAIVGVSLAQSVVGKNLESHDVVGTNKFSCTMTRYDRTSEFRE